MTKQNEEKYPELYLKVKKVILADGTEYKGIIVPIWLGGCYRFDSESFSLCTVDGSRVTKLYFSECTFENTRITDKKVKEKLTELAKVLKKEYKTQLEIEKMHQEFRKKEIELGKVLDKYEIEEEKCRENVATASGYITPDEFSKAIRTKVEDVFGDSFMSYVSTENGKVEFVQLIKRVSVGRWVTSRDYDFVYEEYDGSLAFFDLESSKDFKELKKKHFNEYGASKLNGFKVSEEFHVVVGPNESVDISQRVKVDFGGKMDATKENLLPVSACVSTILSKIS